MTLNLKLMVTAREAAGFTQSTLAAQVGVSQAFLSKVEHGLKPPPPALVESIADAVRVPVEFFSQERPPAGEGIVDFFHRKRATLPVKPLRKAQAIVNMIRHEVLNLLEVVDLPDAAPLPEFPSDEYESPEEIASLVRATWRVPRGPLPDLIGLIEATGTPVVLAGLGHPKLSAICVPGANGRPIIVLNKDLPASHQRFSLAHDLGHLVMHSGQTGPDDIEQEADRFAAELLMPSADIAAALRGLRFSSLGQLKNVWRVSMAALIRKAYTLRQIEKRQYEFLNIQLGQTPGGRKREPGEFEPEEPKLVRHVIEHLRDRTGYTIEEIAAVMVADPAVVRERYLGEAPRILRAVPNVPKLATIPTLFPDTET